MPLVLQIRPGIDLPIELAAFPWNDLASMTESDIAHLPVWYGNRQEPLGDLFEVRGSASDGDVVVRGDCRNVKGIGSKLAAGRIQIEGIVGNHLGAEMTGGEIFVEGDTADWTGAEMRGGRIQVIGNAGDQVGGAYRGSKKGMRGGEILIHGNAGIELGARQRRGLIAVGGMVGAGCGFGMIAGTILIGGGVSSSCGIGMKRGSIIFLQPGSDRSVPMTFCPSITMRTTFLTLFEKHLRQAGFPIEEGIGQRRFRTWRGDLVSLGLGEILSPAQEN